MKSPMKLSSASILAKNARPPLNIVITYADRLTQQIAMKVCSGVVRRISRAFAVHTLSWSFDALSQPDALERAVAVTCRADMVFCSAHASRNLPAAVRAWADGWRPRTGQADGALVALLKTNGQAGGAILAAENELGALAKAARMDFFVKFFDQRVPETSSFDSLRPARRKGGCQGRAELALFRHAIRLSHA